MFSGRSDVLPPASPLTGRPQPQPSPKGSQPRPNVLTGNYASPREPSYSQASLSGDEFGAPFGGAGSALPRTGSGRVVAGMI